jgi:hypothetical protein
MDVPTNAVWRRLYLRPRLLGFSHNLSGCHLLFGSGLEESICKISQDLLSEALRKQRRNTIANLSVNVPPFALE